MTNRQQLTSRYIVGQYRSADGTIIIQAATSTRRRSYLANEWKTFASRQAATRWRDYIPERYGEDARDLAVMALPVPQDD